MQRLQNKVAVITGGNSGIGRGIAKCFHDEGAKVVIFGRNLETLNQVKDELKKDILVVQGDVTNSEDLKNLFKKTVSHYGKIDVLVVNAGVAERRHVTEWEEKDFEHLVDINYKGAFFTAKYAVDFLNDNSSIIFLGSIAGHLTIKGHSVYSSTKAAVIQLAKNFSYDLSSQKIRVNSISPGYIATPIFGEVLKNEPNFLEEKKNNIPLKRIGTPEDIAHAALFLASDEASYITGADLVVDGGYCASFKAED